jgi:DNA-binding response OmpR family regulator
MALPRRILVVDDDADVRVVMTTALEMEGYAVSVATDGAGALRAIADERPDLILLDLRMPGLSGWDVAEALKEGGVGVPILALGAAPDAGSAAAEIGAAGWIAKPFDVLDLLEKVARLCPPA